MSDEKDDLPIEDRIEDIEKAEAEALAESEAAEQAAADPTPEDAIRALQAELDETRDQMMRLAADAQNTRRRAEKDVKDARAYAISAFAGDVLGVADNLSRALEAARGETLEGAAKTLVDGVALTEKSLLSALDRHGVKKIAPEPGDAFDPNRHQATAQIPSEHPNGSVASLFAPGYVIGERTLRAAMVAVSAGTPVEKEPANDDDKPEPGAGLDVKA